MKAIEGLFFQLSGLMHLFYYPPPSRSGEHWDFFDSMSGARECTTWVVSAGLALVIFAVCTQAAQAQVCASTNITLRTQTEVNNFQSTFGPCTEVAGELEVRDDKDGIDPVINLDGLSDLTTIKDLSIPVNLELTSIEGLSGLSGSIGNLSISGNPELTSLSGLEGLTSVEGVLSITGNDKLTDLAELSGLTGPLGNSLSIQENDGLTSLDGLGGLTSVGGTLCESGVESEDQHCSGEPTEHMHDQALVGTHL